MVLIVLKMGRRASFVTLPICLAKEKEYHSTEIHIPPSALLEIRVGIYIFRIRVKKIPGGACSARDGDQAPGTFRHQPRW